MCDGQQLKRCVRQGFGKRELLKMAEATVEVEKKGMGRIEEGL